MARLADFVDTEFGSILRLLVEGQVEFILIGGLAAIGHGLAGATYDVDVVYARNQQNISKVVNTLAGIEPYLRGAPPGLPFKFDEKTVRMGLNFTLRTTLGDIDLLGEVVGGGRYEDLLNFSEMTTAYGVRVRSLTLDKLIEVKRAAGRPKDFNMVAELEALRQEKRKLEAEGS